MPQILPLRMWVWAPSEGQGSSEVFLLGSCSGPLSLASDEGCRRADPVAAVCAHQPAPTQLAADSASEEKPPVSIRAQDCVWVHRAQQPPSRPQVRVYPGAGTVLTSTGVPGGDGLRHRWGAGPGQTLASLTVCGREKEGGASSKTGSPGRSLGPLRSASLRAGPQEGLRPLHEGTGV